MLNVWLDEMLTVLGAENDMEKNTRKGLGH